MSEYGDIPLSLKVGVAKTLGILSRIEADIQTEIGHLETNTEDSQ